MNVTDLIAYAQQLGVPVSLVILPVALYWFFIKPTAAWLKTDIIPRWVTLQEQQAKAMDDIAEIVRSLQYEVRESRRVSDANAVRLAAMDGKLDQLTGRPVNSRTRGGTS
jgi:hypothetical protein